MKKFSTLLIVLMVIGLVSLTYAQQQPPKASQPVQMKIFTGTIVKITPADAVKKVPAEIVAKGADQKDLTFKVSKAAAITGTDGKPTTLDKLKAGDKVEIKYHTTESGAHVARAIKLAA